MKKKITSLVLTLCLVCMSVMFTACSESDYSTVDAAVKKTQELDSMAAEMEMKMDMEMDGMTLSIPIKADIKAKDINSDSPVVSSVMSVTMLGQSMDIEMYQEGDWAYMVVDGVEYKTSVDNIESEYDYSDDINDMIQVIPEELFEGVEGEKGDDGSVTFTVPIPDDKFADLYGDFLDGVSAGSGVETEGLEISDAVVTITVNDGYVTEYDMEFSMDITVEGMSATADVNATVTLKDPGEDVTITPPEGYEDFEEILPDEIN